MQSLFPETPETWFVFQNDRLLVMKNSHEISLPSLPALSHLKPHFIRQHKLGLYNKAICYCAEIDTQITLPDTIESVSLRKAFELLGSDWYLAVVKAYSIVSWDKNHQFCGRCGDKTVHKPDSFERVCNTCGLSVYPRISPCMIVLIHKGDQILMSRSPHFPPGAYGLVAGFVEVGESIEDTVHREVYEEVGIQIKNLKYFGSQPWPFPDSLMIGFTAEYASGDLVIDHNEIEDAGWYRYDNLPGRPSTSISIAAKLIDSFISKQSKQA